MIVLIVLLVIAILFLVLISLNTRIVPQANEYVVERLGTFYTVWKAGLHVKLPFIDKVVNKINLKEKVLDFPPQPVITKDNVTMHIDTVVYAKVTDAKLFTYGIENPDVAIETLTATTLRNIVGEMELDATLTSRDAINSRMNIILDEATDAWGIKVIRVEIKNIMPPREIQDAMEKQMKAERERRAKILDAEGEKRSAILVAEGEKEAAILRADAEKQKRIKEAEGEAQAILATQKAYADSIKVLNSSKPTPEVLQIKAMETLRDLGYGKATKLIVPSEIANLGGVLAGLKATADIGKDEKPSRKAKKDTYTQDSLI